MNLKTIGIIILILSGVLFAISIKTNSERKIKKAEFDAPLIFLFIH